MAFTEGLDVDVGDPTKASDYDTLADNPEWLRDKSDVCHDFSISTGDGYHRGEYDGGLIIKNDAEDAWAYIWLENDGGTVRLRANLGITEVAATPSAVDDGEVFQLATLSSSPL